MLEDFISTLHRTSQVAGVELDFWLGSTRKSRNLLELSDSYGSIILYIKESNTLPGWWGLNPEQLNRLVESKCTWLVALLSGTKRIVYVVTPREVGMRAGSIWKQAPKDLDFKVHENAELVGITSLDYEELSECLIYLLAQQRNREQGGCGAARRCERTEYEMLLASAPDPSDIAEFLVRVPGSRRQVAHVSISNLRLLDLLAGLAAILLAPGDSPEALASKAIPLIARMIHVLSDEEALVIRVMCEVTAGHPRLAGC